MKRTRRRSGARVRKRPYSFRLRVQLLFGALACVAVGLVGRAVELQLIDHGFLSRQGEQRFSRIVTITAHRGTITDRNGEPLAISTPVDSIWVDPRQLNGHARALARLAHVLGINRFELERHVAANRHRDFLYVARGLQPADGRAVEALKIPGVNLSREYRRYYPAGEVTGHLVGFTNIDDRGQDGVELAFDHWLAGQDGAKRVIQDSMGREVEDVESIRAVRPGRNLALSIDLRIQFLAYRALKAAVLANHAAAGSMVVLNVGTGEVLAMVDQPGFNPNDRDQLIPADYRNRAVTDMFEPGSSIKPFILAAALQSGKFAPDSLIDTNPGYVRVDDDTITDERDLGVIDLATVLAMSSNVGMAKIALQLQPRSIWTVLSRFGFGQPTASGLPGESGGELTGYEHWTPVHIATMSHGYGVAVTALQLAQAYATIGAYGIRRPISVLRVNSPPVGERVLSASLCRSLLTLMRSVVTQAGATGVLARIPGYSVAGKTGTAWIAHDGHYVHDHYTAVFAGLAPASDPRLAAVVVIEKPSAGKYYGGDVSAPVFSAVVGRALRLLGVPPDQPGPQRAPLSGPQVARR